MRRLLLILVFMIVAFAAVSAGLRPANAAATVKHGFSGAFFVRDPAAEREAVLTELGVKLGVDVVRVDVSWSLAEPVQGEYDDAGYLKSVQDIIAAARARDMEVIVMVWQVPRWASDRSFWSSPPSSSYSGYQTFYPVDGDSLDDLSRLATHLATLLKGQVLAYECWNEPNLWPYIYPQQARGDGLFAAHTYVKYLKRFSPGIREGDPDALVLAGATAPMGSNDRYRTSPQRFGKAIKDADVGDLFDGYSHHPYCIGGRKNVDPATQPAQPQFTVETGNIGVLLDMFPNKPFYLTEYGYNTSYSYQFGPAVSEIQQAAYMKKAFRLMAKHPQVKVLVWHQLRDWSDKGKVYSPNGVYMGLRNLDGRAKRGWYAFARGNRISVNAATSAPRGASVRLQGAYTCASVGGVTGRALLLQRKWGAGAWYTLRTVTTGTNGYYKTFVTLKRSTKYRLVYQGVVSSAAHLVRAR